MSFGGRVSLSEADAQGFRVKKTKKQKNPLCPNTQPGGRLQETAEEALL